MPGASLRTEGDDHRGPERIDDRHERRPQLAQHIERCEAAVRKTEQVELSHAEPLGRAVRLLGACGGQLRSGRDVGEIANALGAVGGDHEMGLASFPREPRQQRADDAFVVGVSEDGDHGPPDLSLRRERDDRGQRHGDEGMYGDAHGCSSHDGRAPIRPCCRPSHSPSTSHTAAIGTAAKAIPDRPSPSAVSPANPHAPIWSPPR